MKKYPLLLTLAILIAAACNFPGALATRPSTTPDKTPAVTPFPAGSGPQTGLTGTTWTWIGFTSPNEQIAVESPLSYSLNFQQDGTVTINADCNHGQGSYQIQGQSIQIQAGAMTRVQCPPGSRSDQFLKYLAGAATYSMNEGNLDVDLAADGGTLVFAPSGAVTAGNEKDALQALQANPWQWAGFASPAGQYDIESPGNYLLTFHDNGTVDIQADCNTTSGTYTLDAVKISIQIGSATLAACPAGSRGEEFLRDLKSAAIYFYQPGELFLNLAANGGTMRFTPAVSQK